jgi:hypothetical protein
MLPLLRPGDTVSIQPGKDCRVGDIILWRKGQALVLHRVVTRRNGRIITKGDSLSYLDAPVWPAQTLGRAVVRERHGRIKGLDHPGRRFLGLAWCLLTWIPGLVVFLVTTRRTLKNMAQLPSR